MPRKPPNSQEDQRDSGAEKRARRARGAGRSRLLASAKLTDRKIKQVIRCYAETKSPKEAQEICGLSHVTIYRLYHLIRRRLFEAVVFTTMDAYTANQDYVEKELDGWFDWQGFREFIREQLRPKYGVSSKNKELYLSEAVFRWQYAHEFTPDQVYRLVLVATNIDPLNKPATFATFMITQREFKRLQGIDLVRAMRHMDLPQPYVDMIYQLGDGHQKAMGKMHKALLRKKQSEKKPG